MVQQGPLDRPRIDQTHVKLFVFRSFVNSFYYTSYTHVPKHNKHNKGFVNSNLGIATRPV